MGLRRRWVAFAVGRAHALVVEVPGWWATRVAVEQDLARRGWRSALSPADADVLIVCGEPDGGLAEVIDRVWDQLPGPRARVGATGREVAAALDEAAMQLADHDGQADDARHRGSPIEERRNKHGDTDQGGQEDSGDHNGDRSSTDHGDTDHGDTDHGDMDMGPAGIALASGAEGRDGLEMDVLHVPLGPVLPHWPAGLVLRGVLHGDVVADAEVEVLGGRGMPRPWAVSVLPALRAAAACDGVACLLAVAGWDDAATAARRVRDLVLDDSADRAQAARQLERLRSRVTRSWSLRWLLRGLGPLDDSVVRSRGLPVDVRGDVHDRLVAMLARAVAELRTEAVGSDTDPYAVLDALPEAVSGLELGAVRLVVASLHPDTAGVLRREHARA